MDDPGRWAKRPRMASGLWDAGLPLGARMDPGFHHGGPPPPFEEPRGPGYREDFLPPASSEKFRDSPHHPIGHESRGLPTAPIALSPVGLNPADCNIDFDCHPDGVGGSALSKGGFGYCWSGARATLGLLPCFKYPIGLNPARYCFGCVITENQPVELDDTPLAQRHLLRVGLSRDDTDVGSLGEHPWSFGFGGTGKASTAGRFTDFGEPFGAGDTLVCTVEFSWPSRLDTGDGGGTDPLPRLRIGFFKNRKWLGFAFDTPVETSKCAYFPHVLLKNVSVRMQFGLADGLAPPDGFLPWTNIRRWEPWGGRFQPPPRACGREGPFISAFAGSEVVMMVGIPGSGKTTWAERLQREKPEKRYIILGTDLAIDQMKVPGLTRKRSYSQRFEHLMPRATEIFNTLLERASRVPRNYILDQTNVYFSARRRKLRAFVRFKKIAVVVVCPPEEQKRRSAKRTQELGKEVPEDAVDQMKANFSLPQLPPHGGQSKEGFDAITFVELPEQEAYHVVQQDARFAKRFGNFSKPPPLAPASASPIGVAGAYNNQQGPHTSRFSSGALSQQQGLPPQHHHEPPPPRGPTQQYAGPYDPPPRNGKRPYALESLPPPSLPPHQGWPKESIIGYGGGVEYDERRTIFDQGPPMYAPPMQEPAHVGGGGLAHGAPSLSRVLQREIYEEAPPWRNSGYRDEGVPPLVGGGGFSAHVPPPGQFEREMLSEGYVGGAFDPPPSAGNGYGADNVTNGGSYGARGGRGDGTYGVAVGNGSFGFGKEELRQVERGYEQDLWKGGGARGEVGTRGYGYGLDPAEGMRGGFDPSMRALESHGYGLPPGRRY